MGGKTTSMNNQYLGFAQASFHSTKWHNGLNSRKVSSISPDGITEIANKLDSLTRDIKNLKENMHAIQVRCETCGGAHLDKECPLHEDVKYHVGPPGYYTRVDNRPPFDENRPNLKELMNKHLEESTWRRADMEDRLKKLQESTNMNIRNQNASLKNLETQVKQLTKDYQAEVANEIPNSSIGQCKAIFTDNEAPRDEISSNGTNELHGVFFISDDNVMVSKKMDEGQSGVLSCQLPLKELMENVLVKINKFVFPTDFVSIDMSGDPNETMILGRPFLATIHAQINVIRGEISIGIGEDKIMFDINRNIHHHTIHVEKVYMANYIQEEESLYPLELSKDLFSCDSPLCLKFEKYNHLYETNQNNEYTIISDDVQGQFRGKEKMVKPDMTTSGKDG
ncbi:MAK10-like protein [Tanacetum coccineum]